MKIEGYRRKRRAARLWRYDNLSSPALDRHKENNGMNATQPNETKVEEMIFDDLEIEVPESGADYETIPAGMYPARLVGFKTTDKPDWKLKGEEGEDKYQWEWTFQIDGGDYDGVKIVDWTSRSWHERATAHKHAAALLGVPTLPVGVGMSTKQLAGRIAQIWVVEKGTKKDPTAMRNYIDKVVPLPAPRQRPARPQNTVQVLVGDEFDKAMAERKQSAPAAPQATVKGGRVQLPNYPVDAVEGDAEWTIDQ